MTHLLSRPGARVRALALALATALAFFLIAAAGHHHDSAPATHACAICSVLMDELPSTGRPPTPTVSTVAQVYFLARAVAYVCLYRFPLLIPPSCGPPPEAWQPGVAIV